MQAVVPPACSPSPVPEYSAMAVMDMKKVAVLLLLSDLSGVLEKRATLQGGEGGTGS
jgi:hypothetical protein